MPTNYTIVSNCKVILYTFRKVHYPVILYTKDYLQLTHTWTQLYQYYAYTHKYIDFMQQF